MIPPALPPGFEEPVWLALLAPTAMLLFFVLVGLRIWRMRRADQQRERAELKRSIERNDGGWAA